MARCTPTLTADSDKPVRSAASAAESRDVYLRRPDRGRHRLGEQTGQLHPAGGLTRLLRDDGHADSSRPFVRCDRQRARAARDGRQRIDGFSFDVEVLLLARAMGFSIAQMPVHWTNSATSRVHVVRDSMRMFSDVIRVRGLVNRTMYEFPYR